MSEREHTLGRFAHSPAARYFRRNCGIIIALAAIVVALSFASEYFLTGRNLTNLLRQITTNALLAYAITFCLIIGCIDLTIGSYVGLSGILCAQMMSHFGLGFVPAMLVGVAACVLCGFVNGFVIANTGMPPYIVTLAMQGIVRGAAYLFSDGVAVKVSNEAFFSFGNGYVFGVVPIPVLLFTVIALVMSRLLTHTVFGKHMYALGGNSEAAVYSGINIKKIKVVVYMVSGALAGFAGIIVASRVYSGQPTAGTGFESDAVAAAVLGGTSFGGGRGTIGGTVIGILVIGTIANGLNLLEVSTYWQMVIKGLIILLAVYSDTLKERKKR